MGMAMQREKRKKEDKLKNQIVKTYINTSILTALICFRSKVKK